MTKVAIYARVSTEEQHTENQVPVLEEWAKQRGWEVVRVYKEDASAYKAGHQKVFAELTKDIRHCDFQILLVWALDRITREGAETILRTVRQFGEFGVKIISHEESWTEFPSELTPLMFAIFGWVANFDSQRRSARTKIGMARARAQGKHIGRPKGSRDKDKRRRLGYLLREATAEEKRKYGDRK